MKRDPYEAARARVEQAAGIQPGPQVESAGAVSLSEDALALQFADEHRDAFKWTPGLDWMTNRGDHWQRDDSLRRFDVARTLCRDIAGHTADRKEAKRLSSAATVAAVLKLAQSDRSIVLPASVWDADPFALNTPGGIVDLSTGTTRARACDDFLTQITRVAPCASACPTWTQFIDDVFMDDRGMVEFVQRMLGYFLSADRSEQKVFFLYGLGANGKSTLIDLVSWIMGSYAAKLPATVLMQTNVERHPTELAQLRGKRLAVSSELDEGQFWAESRIKELTGDAVLTARYMRQDNFEFSMTQTHCIVGNYKPRMRGGDAALARRFVLVPFLAKFDGEKRDPHMLDKLRAEAPAVLRWMIDGAVKWRASGLAIPETVAEASREYMADNDDVLTWTVECCQRSPYASARASDLYRSFTDWIKSRGQHPPSQTLWGSRLGVMDGISKRTSNGVRYHGIKLKDEEANRMLTEASRWVR